MVVDRALKMMEVTEALDLQESMQKKHEKETAVGKSKQHSIVLKRKRKDGSKDESGVNHDQDKFFEWLSRKAKQEHERTKDKSKTAGPYRSPLASNVTFSGSSSFGVESQNFLVNRYDSLVTKVPNLRAGMVEHQYPTFYTNLRLT